MKARVKATGKIVSVKVANKGFDYNGMSFVNYTDDKGEYYADHQLDFDNPDGSPEDYWTSLEHQYAGMAMQGMLSNPEVDLDYKSDECMPQALAATAYIIAHALVEKMKEMEERK